MFCAGAGNSSDETGNSRVFSSFDKTNTARVEGGMTTTKTILYGCDYLMAERDNFVGVVACGGFRTCRRTGNAALRSACQVQNVRFGRRQRLGEESIEQAASRLGA